MNIKLKPWRKRKHFYYYHTVMFKTERWWTRGKKESEGEEGRNKGRKVGTRDILYLDMFHFFDI